MSHDEMIAVIQAHRDGRQIEFREKGETIWCQCLAPWWNFSSCEYRIKSEPREWWIFPMGDKPSAKLYALGTKERAQGMPGVIHVREILE